MSFAAKLVSPFNFRRISSQIAALILVSLVLIHGLIAAYLFLNRSEPRLLADQPMQQFEICARVIAGAPASDRARLVQHFGRAFPALALRLREDETAADQPGTIWSHTVPWALGGRVEIVRTSSASAERAWFHLPDGKLLEATVGSPPLPPFVGGLWTSTVLFVLVSITLLAVWAGRALSSPLSTFARAAESFSLNRSSASIPETGPEEIRAAARALNRMRERISGLMNDRTRMLAAISHDLRTPITRLRLRSEYITDDTQRAQTLRDLDQMQSMLESVLSLFRSGSTRPPTLVDVAGLLQTICEDFSDCGHAVIYCGPSRAVLMVRPDELRRAVTNLIENALRFGTEVIVKLAVAGTRAMIEVADDGPGIPDQQKPAMLEPFVRGEEARTMDATSGFGLGLSIAQAVAHAHNGTLSLGDNHPHGLVVRLLLPEAAPPLGQLEAPRERSGRDQ